MPPLVEMDEARSRKAINLSNLISTDIDWQILECCQVNFSGSIGAAMKPSKTNILVT